MAVGWGRRPGPATGGRAGGRGIQQGVGQRRLGAGWWPVAGTAGWQLGGGGVGDGDGEAAKTEEQAARGGTVAGWRSSGGQAVLARWRRRRSGWKWSGSSRGATAVRVNMGETMRQRWRIGGRCSEEEAGRGAVAGHKPGQAGRGLGVHVAALGSHVHVVLRALAIN